MGDPKVKALTDVWQEEWTAARGAPYVWTSWPKVSATVSGFAVTPDVFRGAVRRYLRAEASGGVWPKEKAPSLSKFALDAASWLNAAPVVPVAAPKAAAATPRAWAAALEHLAGHVDGWLLDLLRRTPAHEVDGTIDLRPPDGDDTLNLVLDERLVEDLRDALGPVGLRLRGRALLAVAAARG